MFNHRFLYFQIQFRKSFPYLLLSLSLLSCEWDDIPAVKPLESFNVGFIINDDPTLFPSASPPLVKIEYDNHGHAVKKVGGIIAFNPATGFSNQFSTEIYDSVVHKNNEAIIIRKQKYKDFTYLNFESKKLIFSSQKISITVVQPYIQTTDYYVDSVFFYYNKSGNLIKTIGRYWSIWTNPNQKYQLSEEVKDYYYRDDNLMKITGVNRNRFGYATTTLELFDGYDNAPNPTRRLGLFDDLFFRSLSKNNFTKYHFEGKTPDGTLFKTMSREWTLRYDSKGIPTFL